MPELEALHGEILAQVDRLIAVAEDPGDFPSARTPVSGWSPLLHAEHMSKADAGSLHQLETALERGRSGETGPRIKLAGRLILRLGWIPRGAGKAPESSRPEEAERHEVAGALRSVRGRIEALHDHLAEVATSRGRSSHPIFGGLSAGQWFRFLWIHHHHHLKIVADIGKAWKQ